MKKVTILFLCLFLFVSKVNASARAYVVMDAESGRVLMGSNINEKNLIASTTNIMTI